MKTKKYMIVNGFRSAFSVIAFSTAIMITSIVIAPMAHAGASGCQLTKGFSIGVKGVTAPIPGGQLCHTIKGKDKLITAQKAAFSKNLGKPGVTCNWRIDFLYYSNTGNMYDRDKGRTSNNCQLIVQRTVTADKSLPHYGRSCARLYVNGNPKVTQCHQITEGFKLW